MFQVARNILVTGTNRGIGFGLVKELVKLNPSPGHIFATCRNPAGPESKALQNFATQHDNTYVVQLDTTDLSSIRRAVSEVESHLKGQGLNLLINNAARNSQALFLENVDQEDMLSSYKTNAVGPLLVVKEFLPLLKKAAKETTKQNMGGSKAVVINISSVISSIGQGFKTVIVPVPPMYQYRVSKTALNMVNACLAEELKKDGIACVLLHPGWVKTDMGSEQTLNELASKYSNIHIIQLEVEDQSSVKAAASVVESLLHGKGLNLLINNAGVNSYATLETVEQQEMLSAFNTNVVGPILVVKEFLPLLKKAARAATMKEMSCQRAAIINITSKLASIERGFEVMKGPMYPYRASKAPVTVQNSVRGILNVLANLSSASNGAFLDWEGNALPW
ncbi:uncharacterized protein LOC131184320 isoform X2 [Ahaetulla prasina]|uniref:uncharacterized protein LOC131184320 isoform X2 n=1 Tax=Ahaetulla prasina TaxID=499056 RepID=UPI002649E760|nr:uncharacterized protein LOC131184320 isoform X2 [Ahaetulla prasina]